MTSVPSQAQPGEKALHLTPGVGKHVPTLEQAGVTGNPHSELSGQSAVEVQVPVPPASPVGTPASVSPRTHFSVVLPPGGGQSKEKSLHVGVCEPTQLRDEEDVLRYAHIVAT